MRWMVDCNWKLAAANFAGDGQHTFTTHGFQGAVGLELIRGKSYALPTKNGHTAGLKCWLGEAPEEPYIALPQQLWSEVERHLKPDQLQVLRSLATLVGNVFPNTSFLETTVRLPPEGSGQNGRAMSFLTLRQWQPKGVGKTEVWSWFLVDRNAPAWWKEASREWFSRSFGMAGVFEQDDTENWGEITRSLSSPVASRLRLQYKMGMERRLAEEWPGSVAVYAQPSFSEINERAFYDHWKKMMKQKER